MVNIRKKSDSNEKSNIHKELLIDLLRNDGDEPQEAELSILLDNFL